MHKTIILVNTCLELFHILLIFSFRDYERPITEEEEGVVGTENQQETADRGQHQYGTAGQQQQADTHFWMTSSVVNLIIIISITNRQEFWVFFVNITCKANTSISRSKLRKKLVYCMTFIHIFCLILGSMCFNIRGISVMNASVFLWIDIKHEFCIFL